MSQELIPSTTEWTVIAPDGTRFTGPTPFKAALPASKYRLEIDPVAAAKFAEVIDQIAEEGEAERDQCMRDYGTLDCPHCGGSGHIADAMAAQPAQMPDGYVLVPVEPTQAMQYAGLYARNNAVIESITTAIYRAMLAAAPSTKEPGWLPIESAPKDGSRILIHTPNSRHKVQEAWWAIPYEGTPDGWWSTPTSPTGRGYMILPEAATHWQPLPAAPSTKEPGK